MKLHFNMTQVKCLRFSDSGAAGEYYFTWRAYVAGSDQEEVAQGFSLGCPVDDGYSLAVGEERALNDPKFTIALPDVAKGEEKTVKLDLFGWECDHSGAEVKRLFSNEASRKLVAIHNASEKQQNATRTNMLKWLEVGDNEAVSALVTKGAVPASSVTPYVAVGKAVGKVFSLVLGAIKSNSDDYLGTVGASVTYARSQDGRLRYRWTFDAGVGLWIDQERPVIRQSWKLFEANRDNKLDCEFIIQIVSNPSDEFSEPADGLRG